MDVFSINTGNQWECIEKHEKLHILGGFNVNAIDKLEQFVLKDEPYQQAIKQFESMVKRADEVAGELFEMLNKQLVNDETFTLDAALIAAARTLMYLSQFYYEDKDEFIKQLEHVRQVASTRVAVAIDNPTPCGACANCLKGEICDEPVTDEQMTLAAIPMLACSLVEYTEWVTHVYDLMPEDELEE